MTYTRLCRETQVCEISTVTSHDEDCAGHFVPEISYFLNSPQDYGRFRYDSFKTLQVREVRCTDNSRRHIKDCIQLMRQVNDLFWNHHRCSIMVSQGIQTLDPIKISHWHCRHAAVFPICLKSYVPISLFTSARMMETEEASGIRKPLVNKLTSLESGMSAKFSECSLKLLIQIVMHWSHGGFFGEEGVSENIPKIGLLNQKPAEIDNHATSISAKNISSIDSQQPHFEALCVPYTIFFFKNFLLNVFLMLRKTKFLSQITFFYKPLVR